MGPYHLRVDRRELQALIAGLRIYEEWRAGKVELTQRGTNADPALAVWDLASNGGELAPLGAAEADKLIERLAEDKP